MKLAKHTGNRWHYQLTTQEAEHLRLIVGCFPVGPRHAAKISNTDTDPKTLEREKLLNESLAEHRKELQRKAAALVAPNRFKAQKTNQVYQVTSEDRETLLQILNDIRIESWRILGEPEELEIDPHKIPPDQLRYHQLMYVSGYFEQQLLENAEG